MTEQQQFDAFYHAEREQLLLETYALTGDLVAARSAVRDSFVSAWHHWRATVRHGDPTGAVRAEAWRLAQRRSAARLWHREKEIPADAVATLEALGALSTTQRKALILTRLALVSMPQVASDVGLPLDEAERELHTGSAAFAERRRLAVDEFDEAVAPLREVVAGSSWPRGPIVRRSGTARRRTHTTVGVVVAIALFVVTGLLVTDPTGERPTLAGGVTSTAPTGDLSAPPGVVLPESALVTENQVNAATGGDWSTRRTNDNSEGTGMILPCQRERYADPDGTAAWARVFAAASPQPDTPPRRITQLAEASADERGAQRAYRSLRIWLSDCADERVQLLGTRTAERTGDEATQFVIRSWDDPARMHVIGLARSGRYVTAVAGSVPGVEEPDPAAWAVLLADAVNGVCDLPDAGSCAPDQPEMTDLPSLRAGGPRGLLQEVDLPPVSDQTDPWVGTEARRARTNTAATRCDQTTFTGEYAGTRFTHDATRTFVIPEAALPDEFGITETVGSLPPAAAQQLVVDVRRALGGCADRDLGTDVEETFRADTADTSITTWALTTELSEEQSFSYAMAFLRSGTAVAQLTFVAAPGATFPDGAFDALAQRALDRLSSQPSPG